MLKRINKPESFTKHLSSVDNLEHLKCLQMTNVYHCIREVGLFYKLCYAAFQNY